MDQPNPAALTPPHNGTKETLQQLAWRRMAELGTHGSPLSIRQVWLRGGGEEPHTWSYETVRRVIELGRSNVSDKTVDRMALALDLPVSQVERAAQLRPRLGRFSLPKRADRLTDSERQAVLAVIDAIFSAADRRSGEPLEEVGGRR